MTHDQQPFDVRCEWGLPGLKACLSHSHALVIVDVLSISTGLDIAVPRLTDGAGQAEIGQ